jgi:hypothetical protein
MNDRCEICGCRATVDGEEPRVCQHLCYWILEGWLGWNARTQKVVVRDTRAMNLLPDRLSYPKTVAAARMMGWTGRENRVGTFPRKAMEAAA